MALLETDPSTEISLSSLSRLGDGALLAPLCLHVLLCLKADPWALFSGGDVSHSAALFFYNFLSLSSSDAGPWDAVDALSSLFCTCFLTVETCMCLTGRWL